MDETTGPFASRARAAEIALMDEFGLPEFTELTGVGVGKFTNYSVGVAGVSLRVAEGLADSRRSNKTRSTKQFDS